MTAGDGSSAIDWRIEALERRLDRIDALKPEVMARDLEELAEQMSQVVEELRGVRKALITFGLTIAASSVVFAFTAFQIWGTRR